MIKLFRIYGLHHKQIFKTVKGIKMKDKKFSPYATNKGGFIKSPKVNKDEPRATKTEGRDLRVKRG